MSPISRLGRVIVAMRSRTAAGERTGAARAAGKGVPPAGAHTPEAVSEQMRRGVIARLQAIDLDVPLGRQQGVRAFLEVVLSRELGEGLMQSPRFIEMLGDVQTVIEGNPQVHAELNLLLQELKQGRTA